MARVNRKQFAELRIDQRRLLTNLAVQLRAHVVAYSRSRHSTYARLPDHISLCDIVETCLPTREQLHSLQSLETQLGNDIVLVAYAKPWKRICRRCNGPKR
jgi:hypothetical protein